MMQSGVTIKTFIAHHQRPWWWLALGLIIASAFMLAVWDQYWRDTLTPHVPDEAVAYIRISLPKLAPSADLLETLNSALSDQGLSLPAAHLRREIGFFALEREARLQWYVLARVDRPAASIERLRAGGIAARGLSGGVILVPLTAGGDLPADTLAAGSWERQTGVRVGRRDTIFMYIAPAVVRTQTEFTALAPLVQAMRSPLVLHGRQMRDGALVFGQSTDQRPLPDFDLLVHLDRFPALTSGEAVDWYQAWSQDAYGAWQQHYGIDLRWLVGAPLESLTIAARHSERQIGWYLADYDWQVQATGEPAVFELVRQAISTAVAYELPSRRTRALDDQALFTERVPMPEHWPFVATSTEDRLQLLDIPERNLTIRSWQEGDHLTLTQSDLIAPDLPAPWLQVSTELMRGGIWQYLKGFKAIVATEHSLILR